MLVRLFLKVLPFTSTDFTSLSNNYTSRIRSIRNLVGFVILLPWFIYVSASWRSLVYNHNWKQRNERWFADGSASKSYTYSIL